MAEDVYQVEDEAEVETETPAPETAPDTETTEPAPEPVAPDEADAVDVGGEKMVPLSALKQLREELKILKPLAQEYAQHKPYVDFLRSHPDLISTQSRTPIATPQPEASKEPDPSAIELAKTLDLYTADGSPDHVRAGRLMKVVDQIAETKAQKAIQPYADMSAQDKSTVNFQRALSVTDQSKTYKPSPETLAVMWRGMPAEMTADERVATVMAWAAIGHDVLAGKYHRQPEPPEREPVVTESAGGRHVNRPSISEFEQRIAKLRGLKSEDWNKRTEGYRPGGAVLEE